jgi:ATP-dependent Lon protease
MSVIEKAKSADAVVVLAGFDRSTARLREEVTALFARISDADHCANFCDPFFGVPFDLSRLLIIVTSRWPQAFSGVDRGLLNVAEFPGLLTSQKVQMANRTMIPEALVDHGLAADMLSLDENALHVLIESYTDEAGVRCLDELIRRVVRELIVASTLGDKPVPNVIQSEDLFELAGRPPAFPKIDRESQLRGQTSVLVVDEQGGHRGQASAVLMPGPGRVTIYDSTGTDISKRLSMVPAVVRSRLSDLGVSARFMQEFEMQVAVPSNPLAGDEASTGLATAISIVSLARDRPVDPELAATGTLTVDGRIEPTLGVSHKVLAAHRTGVRRVLLPRGNERDLDQLPPRVHDDITFVPVDDIAQALQVALH